MRRRARQWTEEFIEQQLQQFRHSIPDYPEVHELLEGEIHRRNLNRLKRRIRKMGTSELRELRQTQTEPDSLEVIDTELLIREGTKRLPDSEENARISES